MQSRRPWLRGLWALCAFAAFLLMDLGFLYIYFGEAVTGRFLSGHLLLTLGWSLALTGVAALLRGWGRRVYLVLVGLVFAVLSVTHGIMLNMFRHFFTFAYIAFAGDGAAFIDSSYLMVRKLAVLWAIGCFLLALLAAALTPPGRDDRSPRRALCGLGALVLGILVILGVRVTILRAPETVIWDENDDPGAVYASFTDSRAAMRAVGLYQYTLRDVWLTLGLDRLSGADKEALAEIQDWMDSRAGLHTDNEMSGIFAGKNLIMVQLEAIDTWMLQPEYMPELWAVKEQSIVFENHYTPAYITAGTFNTEFMANTGLLPATQGISVGVYTGNTFTNTLARMFRSAGYTARSFHGSEGTVYNRGAIHLNWGYESYFSGTDMGMENYFMDSGLMAGFEEMTGADPFFSVIITISGHGPYTEDNIASITHWDQALRIARRSEPNYIHAVAHAIETDLFIGELMDALEETGLAEDTALVFYADHYNYYLLDDALEMEIKGVDSYNMEQHTDFFIWSKETGPLSVEKPTFTPDLMPTLANLFGLDCDWAACFGDDAFSDGGGYVIFADNAWFDGAYHLSGSNPERDAEIARRRHINSLILETDWFGR